MFNFCLKKASRQTAEDIQDEHSPQTCEVVYAEEAWDETDITKSPSERGETDFAKTPSDRDKADFAKTPSENSYAACATPNSVTSLLMNAWNPNFRSSTLEMVTRLFGHDLTKLKRASVLGRPVVPTKADLNTFLKEQLVPVEGLACRTPADPKRASTLRTAVRQLNDSLRTRGCLDRLRVPPEAYCRISLHTAGEFDGNANLLADRAQLVRLGVKVHGHLIFPPDDQTRYRAPQQITNSKTAIRKAVQAHTKTGAKGRKQSHDRWQLAFEATIALERSAEDAQADNDAVPALQVNAVAIDFPSAQDFEGDAMTDSWLHKGDLLMDIEALLDDKLQEALAKSIGDHSF